MDVSLQEWQCRKLSRNFGFMIQFCVMTLHHGVFGRILMSAFILKACWGGWWEYKDSAASDWLSCWIGTWRCRHLFLQDVRIWFCCNMVSCATRKEASPLLLWKANNKFWLVMQCWNCKSYVAKLHLSVLMKSYHVGLMSVRILT